MHENEHINLPELAKKIAPFLGEDWGTAPGYQRTEDAQLTGPDGQVLHLTQNSWRKSDNGKVFVDGVIPKELHGHSPRSSGTGKMAATVGQGPAKLADAIRKRCLPEYRATLAAALVVKAESDAADAAVVALRAEITAALGVHTRRGHLENRVEIGREFGKGMYGSMSARPYSDEVELEIRVPRTLAVALARALATLADSGH